MKPRRFPGLFVLIIITSNHGMMQNQLREYSVLLSLLSRIFSILARCRTALFFGLNYLTRIITPLFRITGKKIFTTFKQESPRLRHFGLNHSRTVYLKRVGPLLHQHLMVTLLLLPLLPVQ